MAIESVKQNQSFIGNLNTGNKGKDVKAENVQKFTKLMGETKVTEKTESKLNQMIETIEKLKGVLDYDLTVENLKKYKDAVKSFLEYYTRNELKMEDHIIRDNLGREKKLKMIRSVDQKLNNMTEHMLETHQGHLKMMKDIGEIHGLIINMLL